MSNTGAIARRLFDNWTTKRQFETMAGDLAIASVADGYAAQQRLQALHIPQRGKIVGRKIALSSKAMQQMIGFDTPIAGAIFAGDVHASPARIKAADFVRLGMEFELAIELNADVAPQAEPHSAQSVYALIETVRPCFELVEDRNADYANLDPLTLLADNAWCGGIVLGGEVAHWRALDLNDIPTVVAQDGVADEPANTGAADPLGSLAWVLNHFSARGIGLSKGEQIITGSAVKTRFPGPGDAFRYEVAGASVEVQIA